TTPTPTPTTTAKSAPRLSASTKGKRPLRATTTGEPTDLQRSEAEQLKLVLKRSRHETHISQQSDNDDDDEEEEIAKNDDEDKETDKGGDEVRESEGESEDEEETREEEDEFFDPIPKIPSEEESNNEEEQELRRSEEARIQEEEEANELYFDVNINQGRGLQSSSMSSFMTSMLNPTSDVGIESIFTTASSLTVSLATPTPIMTPSTIATITTSGDAPIPPPTIPSIILENLPTFNSTFRFEERLRLLETSFNEYRQTNQVAGAVFAIPGIVHQYMVQQMKEAVREAVQQ
nr:hypothetical protein [Tanacetum cinerariifolium]